MPLAVVRDEELERLAEQAPEPERSLARELLDLRAGIRRLGGLIAFYSPERVQRAWELTRELLGEE